MYRPSQPGRRTIKRVTDAPFSHSPLVMEGCPDIPTASGCGESPRTGQHRYRLGEDLLRGGAPLSGAATQAGLRYRRVPRALLRASFTQQAGCPGGEGQ